MGRKDESDLKALQPSFAVAATSSNHRLAANMVVNASTLAIGQQQQPQDQLTTADFRKQRAEMKKDLQRKFERWDKETHDRTR